MASGSSSVANPLADTQITEKLTKQNHAVWAAQVLSALRGARLEGYISGKTVAPAAEIEEKVDGKVVKVGNPAYEDWEARDQQILSFLLTSLSRDVMTQIAAATTAAQAWRAIVNMFASQTHARALNVRLALSTTKKGNMTITDYFGKMRSLGDELAAAGKPLEDDDIAAYILNGLDAEFNPIISAHIARVEPISLGELYSQLLSFETRLVCQLCQQRRWTWPQPCADQQPGSWSW